ncbi:MAG: hypothetical protein JXJ04_15875 [Spirochaetales bacterium]|nr:hypothetical protein [Spirochaetales bacterium]
MKKMVIFSLVFLAFSGVFTSQLTADDIEIISLSEVPENIKATAYAALEGVVLFEVNVKIKKFGEIYELKGKLNGKIYKFKIRPDGTLISTKSDNDDDEIPLSEVPENVKATAYTALPGIVLVEAELEIKKSGEIYELEGNLDGMAYELKIKADGTLLKIELEEDDDDTKE